MTSYLTSRRPGILVVDNKEEANVGLRKHGFAVWLARDGREALQLYCRHRDAIDLVLLKVNLPGLDGPQTLAALQRLNPEIRCCFLSGDAGAYTDEELLEQGATALLNKPFRADEMAPVLWQLLGRPDRGPHRSERCPSVLSWRLWVGAACLRASGSLRSIGWRRSSRMPTGP
jgi:CheY-like chemotaxis protein